jgi:hypothetical protein
VVPKLGAAKYSTRPTNYDLFIQWYDYSKYVLI